MSEASLPKVSVIVPMYNIGEFAIPCLRSLSQQTYDNLEILVVDDGSTDSTVAICESSAIGDSRVTVLHKANGGLSSARNYGLARAAGDYAIFVDGDDLLDKRAVAHLVSLAMKTNAQLVTCEYEKTEPKEEFVGDLSGSYEIVSGKRLLEMMLLLDGESGSACAKLYSREVFSLLVFPEGQLFEDFGVEATVFSVLDRVCISKSRIYGYVARPGSITTEKCYGDRHLDGMEKSLETVRGIVSNLPSLESAFSCFEAFCSLRVASRLDLGKCSDKAEAAQYIKSARKHCRTAAGNPLAGRTWRMRCALFSISPALHNLFYRLYGKLTGKVVG